MYTRRTPDAHLKVPPAAKSIPKGPLARPGDRTGGLSRHRHDLVGQPEEGPKLIQKRDVPEFEQDPASRPWLRSFLFGSGRSERDIKSRADVDHFIPWRLYALDLGHNFVLAHRGCNSSKSDLLAAEEHLERWTLRHHDCRNVLEDTFDERDILHDWPATRKVARWAYGQAHQAGRQVWVGAKVELRRLSGAWRGILAGASRPAA